jgi:hypothetical protein
VDRRRRRLHCGLVTWADSKEKQHGPKERNELNTGMIDGAAQKSLQFLNNYLSSKLKDLNIFKLNLS